MIDHYANALQSFAILFLLFSNNSEQTKGHLYKNCVHIIYL